MSLPTHGGLLVKPQRRSHGSPHRVRLNPRWRQTIIPLIRVLEQKDPNTRGHSQYVQRLVDATTGSLGWSKLDRTCASAAALLHDIGKIVVERSTINNHSRHLTPTQVEELIDHPYTGAQIVAGLFPIAVVYGILHHHERWDGIFSGPHGGYPFGLRGTQISPIGRATAAADAFAAMTTQRSYNLPLPNDAAAQQILSEAGKQFDPKMARAFVRQVVPSL